MDRHPERCDRWTAMAIVSPIRAGWRRWLRGYFKAAPHLVLLGRPTRPVGRLMHLSMIGFARWSLVEGLAAPYLLFETNFNGDSDHYLESFALVTPEGILVNWWGAYRFPGVRRVSRFVSFVNEVKLPIAYYYSGYPGASTKMIRTALELERQVQDFSRRALDAPPDAFRRAYDRLLETVQQIRNPRPYDTPQGHTRGLSFFAAVQKDREEELRDAIALLRREPTPVPGDTHFARWAIADRLEPPPDLQQDDTSYLLFATWYDRPDHQYLPDLYRTLDGRAEAIFGPCGFGGGGADAFAAYLLAHEVAPGFEFHAYDGVTVAEICRALKLARRFEAFVAEEQGRAPEELRDRWAAAF
jgi:hypothetical protein